MAIKDIKPGTEEYRELVRKKSRFNHWVFGIGFVGILLLLPLITREMPQTESAKLLTMFLLLGCMALSLVALLAEVCLRYTAWFETRYGDTRANPLKKLENTRKNGKR